MAKRIKLSSEEEQKIEKAYLDTATGKTMFTLTLVACFALIVGLLIETYKISNPGVDYSKLVETLFSYSEQLFIWGSIVALVGLVFYIRFASDFRNNKTVKKEKAPAKKTTKKVTKKVEKVEKKTPVKKTAAKKTTKK